MKTIQAYRFALDLTPAQERTVLAHAGAARVAHNWALARVKAVMDQRAAERSYGVPEDQLTGAGVVVARAAQGVERGEGVRWRRGGGVSKEAFNTGLDALARGLKNWSDSRSGQAGRPPGRVPPVQVPAPHHTVGAVHHRCDPGRAGPQACGAAPAGPVEAARVGPQTRPRVWTRHGADHVRDRAP